MSDAGGRAELQAARLVLAKMGVDPAELLHDVPANNAVPTFTHYVPMVAAAASAGTRRVYRSYWDRIVARWGQRRLDEPSAMEITQFAQEIRSQAVVRRNARGGRSAAEHLIGALRCVYNTAVADGILREDANPAQRVPKPRRSPSTRRGLSEEAVAEINRVAASTGHDRALDTLVLRLHIETACRRGGALALRPIDLDGAQSLVLLREKGDTTRWQPVSPTLLTGLLAHVRTRGSDPDGQLLRYVSGRPITARRYDYLWRRLGQHLPWVAAQQISTHWLRHTTLTWVERNFGYGVARAFAGHTGHSGADTTATYVRADLEEVATAVAALTGEPHPLAITTTNKTCPERARPR